MQTFPPLLLAARAPAWCIAVAERCAGVLTTTTIKTKITTG